MKLGWQPRKWLDKKSKLGFRGYPVGTIEGCLPKLRKNAGTLTPILVRASSPDSLHPQ